MEINQNTLRQFREDYQQTVKTLEEKYGVVIQTRGITYSDNEFHFTTEVVNGKNKDDVRKTQFEHYCQRYSLKKEDFMRNFEVRGVTYQIVGIQPNKRKHPIMIKDVKTGKEYCCGTDFLPFMKQSQPNLKGKHICKYCGKVTDGEDEDLLCPACRRVFGHTFYSEL